jgi:hypothetical protein
MVSFYYNTKLEVKKLKLKKPITLSIFQVNLDKSWCISIHEPVVLEILLDNTQQGFLRLVDKIVLITPRHIVEIMWKVPFKLALV